MLFFIFFSYLLFGSSTISLGEVRLVRTIVQYDPSSLQARTALIPRSATYSNWPIQSKAIPSGLSKPGLKHFTYNLNIKLLLGATISIVYVFYKI